ncbi:cytochrome P450 [Paraburkholderia mimosarum]|uniref:cytochrome P450 n=1 Tax=Paraburkholderia mimosarum TaxID=312026 RepID=UPI00307C7403
MVEAGFPTPIYLCASDTFRPSTTVRRNAAPTVGNAVEELLRMFAPSSTGRVMTRDFEYKGVRFKAGDRVYVRPLLHGMDERTFQCPMHADFARANASQHAAFGTGPHRCAGALLARNEIRVFLEEWFRRIPDFELDPAGQISFEGGMVNCVTRVPLVWDAGGRQPGV